MGNSVFSAYPGLKIVHCAGQVHSNVDPISRLKRRVLIEQGPATDHIKFVELNPQQDLLKDMYTELGPKFEAQLLPVATSYVQTEEAEIRASGSC